ncbi:DUF4381 domain-containing protein [Aliikangiella marina]|uniref:DUF4381 domain-containing protein n=1 Tax=Aliikangiella marina TaxID=1712262 RepID=A0A545T2W0_9GAMM|nr:DUF4381 domain-containing protein [Aliikangiella marina]TQV71552.1 DUF4381 domain-containing protein [Aliikangiella marina]
MAQPSNSQPANPLDQLRDIQLPPDATFWELAPGWWFVIGVAVIYLVYLLIKWNQKRQRLALIKPARKELKSIAELTPDNTAAAELSALLKRICLLYFPKKEVASLSGSQWINFLNQQSPNAIFDDKAKLIFSEMLYRKNQQVAEQDWHALLSQSEQMIEFIIRNRERQAV